METQLQNATTQMNYYNSMIEEQVQVGGGAQAVRNNKLDALNQRLMDSKTGLAALLEQYKPTHPRVKQAEAQVASLEKQFEEEQKREAP